MKETMTIQEAWGWGTTLLMGKGVEQPRLEAEVLLRSVLGWERAALYARLSCCIQGNQLDLYQQLVHRRGDGCPSQYLTGVQEFMSLPFQVDPRVLIPRPESEMLVEWSIQTLQQRNDGGGQILELCTGSGALIVSLLYYLPSLRGVATDISSGALEVAKGNAQGLGVGARVQFVQGDLFRALDGRDGQGYDLVIANPPYIPRGDLAQLPQEVRGYEPHLALDGGRDGLDFYRRIAGEVGAFLLEDGCLVVEIGYDQGAAVAKLLEETGLFQRIEVERDLSGHPRMVVAYRRD